MLLVCWVATCSQRRYEWIKAICRACFPDMQKECEIFMLQDTVIFKTGQNHFWCQHANAPMHKVRLLKDTFSKVSIELFMSPHKWFSESGIWLLSGRCPDLNIIQQIGWIGGSTVSGTKRNHPTSVTDLTFSTVAQSLQRNGGCHRSILILKWICNEMFQQSNMCIILQMCAPFVCATTNVYHIVRITGNIINVTLYPKCLAVLHWHYNDSGSISQLELPMEWVN